MADRHIREIEGVGPELGRRLEDAGVGSSDVLLAVGRTRAGRQELAEATHISESRILGFVNMADLFRIDGVAGEYAELLVCAGVDTVKELRMRDGAKLAEKLAEVNAAQKLTRRVPAQGQVESWIKQAGELPPAVEY